MEWTTVETGDGAKLSVRLFKPAAGEEAAEDVAVVLVHPYTIMGGVQGLLRGIAEGLARRGHRAVTFDMRGAGRSTGRASLTGSSEVGDVVAVCRWVAENLKPRAVLLVGSLRRHHDAILKSEKPKLFIMGTKDGFTSVKQLQNKLKSAAGRVDTHLIEGAGHFQMEGPAFDAQMVDLIVNFIKSLPK